MHFGFPWLCIIILNDKVLFSSGLATKRNEELVIAQYCHTNMKKTTVRHF